MGKRTHSWGSVAPYRSRCTSLLVCVTLLAALGVSRSPSAEAAPGPVLSTSAGEFQPVRGSGYTAWERNTRANPDHYDVYARRDGGTPFKVNAPGTGAANGGISNGRLVYQQFTGKRSDLRFYNLAARRRSAPSGKVNTRAWEYWPSLSGPRLLFGRLNPKSGARAVLIYNSESRTLRRLAAARSARIFLAPGQVNGRYAVWARCTDRGCSVWRRNLVTNKTIKAPSPGSSQHAPSVTPSGVVYFARSRARRCGAGVRLMRWAPGRAPTPVAHLSEGMDIGDTYAYADPFGNVQVLYDRYRCGGKTASDILGVNYQRSVTLSVTVQGDGRVTASALEMDCVVACTKQLRAGTTVTLSAQGTVAGARFVGWGGACTGMGTCTITMDRSKSIVAGFETSFELSVATRGDGSGRVRSSPEGIDCGTQCTRSYAPGSQVALVAEPAPGSVFVEWRGDCGGSSTTCSLTVDAPKEVEAVFGLAPVSLTVVLPGPGSGSVASTPDGITCPGDCSELYIPGTSVTLQATPAALSAFGGWTGACSGTSQSCTLRIDGPTTVGAVFDPAVPGP